MIQAITETQLDIYIQTEDNRIDTSVASTNIRHLMKFTNDMDGSVQYAYGGTETIKDRFTLIRMSYSTTPNMYAGETKLFPAGYWKYEAYEVSWAGEVTIGSGAATDSFNYTPHNVFINRGDNSRIDVLTAGMYLISYTITTSGASNDDLGFQIKRNGTTGIEGRASTYSRSGDNFETGASVVTFLEINDYIQIFINNATAASNVNIENMNVSVVKLMQGGKRPL